MRPQTAAVVLVCVVLASGCGGSPSEPTPPPPAPNPAPVISSVTPATVRVEVGEGVQITAAVTDAETPASQLIFQWGANGPGTFEGSGAQVTFRPAQELVTPAKVDITLTVIERYSVPVRGGTEMRENRTTASTSVQANHSRRELEQLALTFLNDFAAANDTRASAEYCVRNFTDKCRGKASELNDILQIRALYTTISWNVRVDRIDLNADRTVGYIYAPCTFIDIERATGTQLEPHSGICALTARYEPYRWWLCTSNWCGSYDGCNPQPNITTSLAKSFLR